MNPKCLVLFFVFSQLFVSRTTTAAEDKVSPTQAERSAAAKLIPKGASVQVDENFAITSVSISSRGGGGATDADLALLKSLPALRSLTLSGKGITDQGLEQLQSLKSLTFLRLTGTSVTDEGLAAFRKALPNCRVFTSTRRGGTFGGRFGPGLRGGPTSRPDTLYGQIRSRSVQRELKLTAEQQRKVEQMFATLLRRPEYSKFLEKYRAATTDEERNKLRQDLRKSGEFARQKADAEIRKFLDADQLFRLEQLVLQVRGPHALADEKVASELKLTKDQLSRIKKLVGPPVQSTSRFGRFRTRLSYERIRDVFAVLTDEQKAEWKRLLGPGLRARPSPLPGKTPAQTADYWFTQFDRDGDGRLDSREWARSSVIRREFTNEGVDLSKPMTRDEFVKHYLRIRHPRSENSPVSFSCEQRANSISYPYREHADGRARGRLSCGR